MKRLLIALVMAGALLSAGCTPMQEMRREFVAMRYMQEAEVNLRTLPRDATRAIKELDRAVALAPEDAELRCRAARFYAAARAWNKAIPLFETQEKLSPADLTAYAQCLLKTDRAPEGAKICLEIIDRATARVGQPGLAPQESVLLLNDAGYILADANMHVDRAYEAVSAAVEAMPLEAAFVDSIGWALYRRGKVGDAAFYLERARRQSPRDDPEMLYHLGVVYARLGRYSDAIEALEKARSLEPGWNAVQKELQRLGRILPPPALAACRPKSCTIVCSTHDQF